ncbi:MAG: isoaspartyl peptidase/L-asparaginase family protein [Chloroflexota bacterium]
MINISIAVHGGAVNRTRSEINPEQEWEFRKGILAALEAGWKILENNGSALDAVHGAVVKLEDNPIFNAGRGSTLTRERSVECDAGIMCGYELKSGAVCGVKTVRNPVDAARAVMDRSPYAMLRGPEADSFASAIGLATATNDYFIVPHRVKEWEISIKDPKNIFVEGDTVGAVALDSQGNLAASTSTGGLPGRIEGRIGDSPIVGAGFYANNEACAVSITGDGEKVIRGVFAHEVYALMKYGGKSIKEAIEQVFQFNDKQIKAEMGIIGIDCDGNIYIKHNTPTMYRGYRTLDRAVAAVFYEDELR